MTMIRPLAPVVRLALVFSALLALSACSSWLGGNADPPLPGKRISVLSKETVLQPEALAESDGILLPPPDANDEWPGQGGFANHAMHHMEVGERLARIWRSDAGTGSGKRIRLTSQPIVAEGMVFTMDVESRVRAFDANTGKLLWKANLTPPKEDSTIAGGGLAYEDGQLFVSTGYAQVLSLEARTGRLIWRETLSGPVRGAPTVRAGRVLVTTAENQTYCLAFDDGSTLWTHQGIAETASLMAGSSPAVDGNVVVIPYSSGELFALRIENGTVLWQDQLTTVRRTDNVATLSDIRGRPIIDRGRVYAIGHADMLVAIDLRSGRRLWEREVGGVQNPWIAGDFLFTITNSNEAVAFDARSGRIMWVTQLPVWKDEEDKTGRIVWSGPVLASDRLIVTGSNRTLLSLSPYSGAVMGRLEVADGVSIAPVVALNTLYVLTDNADLQAYR